jgi:hypothetical protein
MYANTTLCKVPEGMKLQLFTRTPIHLTDKHLYQFIANESAIPLYLVINAKELLPSSEKSSVLLHIPSDGQMKIETLKLHPQIPTEKIAQEVLGSSSIFSKKTYLNDWKLVSFYESNAEQARYNSRAELIDRELKGSTVVLATRKRCSVAKFPILCLTPSITAKWKVKKIESIARKL